MENDLCTCLCRHHVPVCFWSGSTMQPREGALVVDHGGVCRACEKITLGENNEDLLLTPQAEQRQ